MQEAFDRFIRKKKIERLAPKAIENYKYNFTTFREFYSGRLCDLTQDHIDDYILYLQEETDLSLTTVNNKIRDLRVFLRFCRKQGITTQDYEIKLLRVNEPEIIPFENYQLKQLYDACLMSVGRKFQHGNGFCAKRNYLIMRTLEETGMRISEALRLQIKDLDINKQIIYIRQTKNKKTRMVYFTRALSKEFKKYLMLRQQFLDSNNLASINIFCNQQGRQLNISTIQDAISLYGNMAGLDNVRVSPHTFRHTFARNFLLNGGDIFTLKDILGHSSFDMVYRYARLFDKDRFNVYKRVMEKHTCRLAQKRI